MLMIRVKLTSQTLLNTHPSRQDEPFQSKNLANYANLPKLPAQLEFRKNSIIVPVVVYW